ncbi:methyltransferase type 11 [Grosmannia clavigera kw1407]|uniref:Methyltransferase type 11 n=1 Tax=Grosmannia clavigera (strain kw1407 / UAMH 11150) TaxID=655863 RepID=F0X8S7_GROCL|nr:methyltransferase type 11 [Grosmannia clavigera kw1407]EFX05906.1 methyltransferase type 11 [Grosmannia clavigera kw1407]
MAMPTPKPGLPNGENQPLQAAVLDDANSSLGNDAASSTASITSSILRYRTLNGRTYHSDRGGSQYWGANDDAQNTMLDIQHHVFTLVLDGKLYLAPLPEEINKVLDIGTGTGLWVLDFADQHPQATIIGTDLSPIQPTWVPPNARFEIDDLAEPWTFDEASVDYVHIRWLIGSVRDWPALFKEAYRVLKPGGWIESFECNGLFESDDDSIPEDSATSQWNDIFGAGAKTDFADQYPNAEVIGTDISPIQPAWVPPNLKFEIDDATIPWA